MKEQNPRHKETTACDKCGRLFPNAICSTSPEVWKLLDQVKQKTTFKAHQVIFYQDSQPLGLYTILSGLVKLEFTSEQGQTHTLRYLGAGSALGYRSLL